MDARESPHLQSMDKQQQQQKGGTGDHPAGGQRKLTTPSTLSMTKWIIDAMKKGNGALGNGDSFQNRNEMGSRFGDEVCFETGTGDGLHRRTLVGACVELGLITNSATEEQRKVMDDRLLSHSIFAAKRINKTWSATSATLQRGAYVR